MMKSYFGKHWVLTLAAFWGIALLPAAAEEASATENAVKYDGTLYENPKADVLRRRSKQFEEQVAHLAEGAAPIAPLGFRGALQGLLQYPSLDLKLTVQEQPHPIQEEELSVWQRQKYRSQWFTAPKATVAVTSDWVRYYAEKVAPKLDALYRSTGAEAETFDVTCVMRRTEKGGYDLDFAESAWVEQVRAHKGNSNVYHMVVPVNPADFESFEDAKKVQTKVSVYYVPSEYKRDPGLAEQRWPLCCVRVFFYDAQRKCSDGRGQSHQWAPCYSHAVLGWSYAWMMGTSLAVPVYDGTGALELDKTTECAGWLVTLRGEDECFPRPKSTNPSRQDETATMWWTYCIPFLSFLFTPYMIWVLWQEKQRKLQLIPLAAGERSADESEPMGEKSAALAEWYASPELWRSNADDESEEPMPHVATKRSLEEGFRLAAAVYDSAADLNAQEAYAYNQAAAFLNVSQQRKVDIHPWVCCILCVVAVLLLLIGVLFENRVFLYSFIAVPNLFLCSYCPLYKRMQEDTSRLGRLRHVFINMFYRVLEGTEKVCDDSHIDVYVDEHGRKWRKKDDVDFHSLMRAAALILGPITLLWISPIAFTVWGFGHFYRSYIGQR